MAFLILFPLSPVLSFLMHQSVTYTTDCLNAGTFLISQFLTQSTDVHIQRSCPPRRIH